MADAGEEAVESSCSSAVVESESVNDESAAASVDKTATDAEVSAVAAVAESKKTPLAAQPSKQKIDLLLKATGDAPIMKQKKWSVEADRKIGGIVQFIKKYLRLEPHETLFLYVNQSFAPSPDQILRNLYECFGVDGKLVLHYCKTQAWG